MKCLCNLVLVSAFILVLGLFSVAHAEALFIKDLYFGIQSDSEVMKLQEFLTGEGVYSGPITGNFFSLTLKAVKNYQTQENISPAAGYFGPFTRAKANIKLSVQLQESDNQAVAETGTPTAPVIQPKTMDDAANTMQSQLAALLQQVALLQQQLQVQQQTQQSVQNLQSQVSQQTQTIQQPQTQNPADIPTIQILSINTTSTATSVKIEWQTNLPSDSKIFLSGGEISSKVFNSESGLSTHHIVNITSLVSNTTYYYEVEAIAKGTSNMFVKRSDEFKTQTEKYFWNKMTKRMTCSPSSTPMRRSLTAIEENSLPSEIRGMDPKMRFEWYAGLDSFCVK
ncbi:MAG: peptidoglycan-binding protein [Candidatus Jorgensenbacteria bacterium]|nr:peptidoglycan-binding protein [Candidatus Jorgensenbacteria bacterium]